MHFWAWSCQPPPLSLKCPAWGLRCSVVPGSASSKAGRCRERALVVNLLLIVYSPQIGIPGGLDWHWENKPTLILEWGCPAQGNTPCEWAKQQPVPWEAAGTREWGLCRCRLRTNMLEGKAPSWGCGVGAPVENQGCPTLYLHIPRSQML